MYDTSREWWVAVAAYYKWIEAGQPEGRQDEFWFAAERDYEAWLVAIGVKHERTDTA